MIYLSHRGLNCMNGIVALLLENGFNADEIDKINGSL